jgi:hypothetical protein
MNNNQTRIFANSLISEVTSIVIPKLIRQPEPIEIPEMGASVLSILNQK